jgi:hypothetical protein
MNPSRRKSLLSFGALDQEGAAQVTRGPTRINLGKRVLQGELARPNNAVGWLVMPKLAEEQTHARLGIETLCGLNALGLGTLVVNLPGRGQPIRATAN